MGERYYAKKRMASATFAQKADGTPSTTVGVDKDLPIRQPDISFSGMRHGSGPRTPARQV